MAIKFDELLEALNPSLDIIEESVSDSLWIIIPTERRYDDLTFKDYSEFVRKYGVFNSRDECWEKIDELAPDRWDAFIPVRFDDDGYLTESFWNPGKEFLDFERVLDEFDDSGWNSWNQEERDAFAETVAKKYLEINPTPTPMFYQDLTDNNCHTFRNAFQRLLSKSYRESLNESMTKADLRAKKYIISYLTREFPKIASFLNDFDFKLTENPDTTGYIDFNTKHIVLNRNLSPEDAIKCILDPLREKEFKQALKDPEFIQQMKDDNKEIEKLLREKDGSLTEAVNFSKKSLYNESFSKKDLLDYLKNNLKSGIKVKSIEVFPSQGKGYKAVIVHLSPDKFDNNGYGYEATWVKKETSEKDFFKNLANTLNDEISKINESLTEDYLDPYIDELAEPLSRYMQMSSKHFNAVCDYIDDKLGKPGRGLSQLNKRDLETLYSVFIEGDRFDESLDLNEYGELQGSNTIAYDKGWEHYESDDMPAGGVWLVKSFETDEGDLEGEIQADSNGVYAAVYKSNGSQVFSKDDFDNIGQAVLTIERVVNDRYNHYNESLNEDFWDPAKIEFFNTMNRKPYFAILDVCMGLDEDGNPHDIPKEWVEEWFERFIKRVYG